MSCRSLGELTPSVADYPTPVTQVARPESACHAKRLSLEMKIATLNVNDVKKRLANLLDWLRQARPDVACLQELKATDTEFPIAAIKKAGYGAVWRGQKSWNGVAILARGCEPVVTRTELPGDPDDTQSRYIEAAVNGVLIATLYAPNGNPQPGPKFKYKLAWMKRLWRTLPSFTPSMRRSCLPEISTSCRPTPTSIRPSPTRTTRLCSRSLGRCFGEFSIRAGSMRSARCIPMRRCTRSGITCETGGNATPASASIICC